MVSVGIINSMHRCDSSASGRYGSCPAKRRHCITTEDGGSKVQRKPVKTGEVRDGRVEIIEGLNAGDVVVSAGQVKLRNGQQVNIDNSVKLDGRIDGG